jgi:hypothetical protein
MELHIAELAQHAATLLAPLLPELLATGQGVAESVRAALLKKVGGGVADVVVKLWGKIAGSPTAHKAAAQAAAEPGDPDNLARLRAEIKDLLRADAAFAAEVQHLLRAAGTTAGGNVATATGTGNVAVGGNVSGGSISTNVSGEKKQ